MRSPRQSHVPPTPLPEAVLRSAKEGNEVGCRELYRHFQPLVFAFLTRMMGAKEQWLAEDLLQETFVRVFKAIPTFDPTGSAKLSTWILTIAYRVALNALKCRRKSISLPQLELVSPSSPYEELRARRLEQALIKAVRQLTPEYRAVFLLRDYHSLTYEEIAAALKLEIGTVKSRLFRARRTIRATLKELSDA